MGAWVRDRRNTAEHIVTEELARLSRELMERAAACPDKTARKQQTAFARSLLSRGAVTKTIAGLKSEPAITAVPENFDQDPHILNTPAGIVDLRSGVMHPPDPKKMCSRSTTVSPSPGVPTKFLEVLSHALGDDPALVGWMQRLFGYALTGLNGEKLLFVVYGPPHTSKSVIFDIVARILGDYHHTIPDGELFALKADNRHPTGLQFVTARLATSGEIRARATWRGEMVKKITGGDRISLRGMRQDFTTVAPTSKIILHGNAIPGTDGADPALVDRLVLIPFRNPVPEENRIRALAERLVEEEGGQILGWMIEGAQRYYREGLMPLPPVLQDERQQFAADEDLLAAFIEERCDRDADGEVTTQELRQAWVQWCNQHGYKAQASETDVSFGRLLRERADDLGIRHVRTRGKGRKPGYRGIKLSDVEDLL